VLLEQNSCGFPELCRPGSTATVCNLWSDPARAALKLELLQKMMNAEMEKEVLWMPRIAQA